MSSLNNPNASDSHGIITEKYITVQAAARLTGYNSQYIRRLLRQGKLDGIRVGQAWLVQLDALFAYLKRAEQASDHRFGSRKPIDHDVYSTVNGDRLQT